VREELDKVMQAIWLALKKRVENNPSPQFSPFGKGRGGTLSESARDGLSNIAASDQVH
jgi:hypothetical protein